MQRGTPGNDEDQLRPKGNNNGKVGTAGDARDANAEIQQLISWSSQGSGTAQPGSVRVRRKWRGLASPESRRCIVTCSTYRVSQKSQTNLKVVYFGLYWG